MEIRDKTIPLPIPPYITCTFLTDHRIGAPKTIFGAIYGDPNFAYAYSDRLTGDKHQNAIKAANTSPYVKGSCAWFEVYLSAYLDKPVIIKHIAIDIDEDRYPYLSFGYIKKENIWGEYIVQEKRGSSHDLHWEDKIYGIDNINRAKDRIKALKDKNPFGQFRIIYQETKQTIIND